MAALKTNLDRSPLLVLSVICTIGALLLRGAGLALSLVTWGAVGYATAIGILSDKNQPTNVRSKFLEWTNLILFPHRVTLSPEIRRSPLLATKSRFSYIVIVFSMSVILTRTPLLPLRNFLSEATGELLDLKFQILAIVLGLSVGDLMYRVALRVRLINNAQ